MPPVRPPALFERWIHAPLASRPSITSWTSEPSRRVCSKPSPSSTPFTLWMLMTAAATAPSSRRSQWTWLPRPIGSPWATTSKTPPTVFPRARASSIRATIRASASGSGQRSGLASVSARLRVQLAGSTATPPTSAVNDQTSIPSTARNARQTAPAATRAAVSRAEARSRTGRTSLKPYFRAPARSACPGRSRVTGCARLLPSAARPASSPAWVAVSGSTCITRVQFSQSRFRIRSRIGEPIVSPCRIPARISARSCSIAWRAPRP